VNFEYVWDSGVWGAARWAKYSATWDNAVWDLSDWNWSWRKEFFDVLAQLEKVNVGEYLFTPGHVVPGMGNFVSKVRDIIRSLEK